MTVPASIRKICESLAGRYIQRCHEEGIALEDFCRVMQQVRRQHPMAPVMSLFQITMRRCKAVK